MAFIRWKKNSYGARQAYLVHSYRDKKGKPKHATLAYLGTAGQLAQEHIADLKAKYPDLPIDWDNIKPAAPMKAAPLTDISGMSDESLLRALRKLRRERGLKLQAMVKALIESGLPDLETMGYSYRLGWPYYSRLEKLFEGEQWSEGVKEIGLQIAPYARKALTKT